MNYGLTMLQMKLTDLKKLSDIYSSQPYSYSIAAVVQATTFVILILLLARHRAAQSKPALDS